MHDVPSCTLGKSKVTTLTTLILFAHTLLIEIPICKKAGAKILPIFLIRVVGGYVFALILNLIYSSLGAYQNQISIPLLTTNDFSLGNWAMLEIRKYIIRLT